MEGKLRPSGVKQAEGVSIFRVLRRLWIPLVVLVVIGAGGFTVSRLHGIFGSEKRPSYVDSNVKDSRRPYNPKQLTYEVFGPPGTVANISYFDVNAEPQHVTGANLPWSLQFAITEASAWAVSWRRAIVTALAAASWWTVKSKPNEYRTK